MHYLQEVCKEVFHEKSANFAKNVSADFFLICMQLGITIGWHDISKSTEYIDGFEDGMLKFVWCLFSHQSWKQ
jgi:hypothetical protein